MMRKLQKGDPIWIRREDTDDEWCPALVAVAGQNNPKEPQSVMLSLLGGLWVGDGIAFQAYGLSVDYEKQTVVGFPFEQPFEINVRSDVVDVANEVGSPKRSSSETRCRTRPNRGEE
jgi:hypothetical protein